jgi:hypothetical protein
MMQSGINRPRSILGGVRAKIKMNNTPKISLSLAAFVLLCFFLPWVELSCMGLRDSVSGYDLARSGDRLLWLVPVLMLVIVILATLQRVREKMPILLALSMTVGGSLSAYLMYREYSSTDRSPKLIATQWTVFFWLGFLACLCVVVAGIVFYTRRSRAP